MTTSPTSSTPPGLPIPFFKKVIEWEEIEKIDETDEEISSNPTNPKTFSLSQIASNNSLIMEIFLRTFDNTYFIKKGQEVEQDLNPIILRRIKNERSRKFRLLNPDEFIKIPPDILKEYTEITKDNAIEIAEALLKKSSSTEEALPETEATIAEEATTAGETEEALPKGTENTTTKTPTKLRMRNPERNFLIVASLVIIISAILFTKKMTERI